MAEIQFKNSPEAIKIENVYCIGKNYLDHIKELDSPEIKSEVPAEPVIFLKPNTSVVTDAREVKIPGFKGKEISSDLQNEAELVIIIGKDGENIPVSEAYSYVSGYAAGIDFTLRDVQNEFKKKGLPWTLSKGFKLSAPLSEAVKTNEPGFADDLRISLKINGITKQDASTSLMIFKVDYIIHYISSVFGLTRGDLIFTGTPKGVSHLNKGDLVEAEIEKIGKLEIKVI
jgi:2-keto-4-pentenoate hydratase/2-oxohepta-3-ene-1,7-dioic acid hydratase in catechol pathway